MEYYPPPPTPPLMLAAARAHGFLRGIRYRLPPELLVQADAIINEIARELWPNDHAMESRKTIEWDLGKPDND